MSTNQTKQQQAPQKVELDEFDVRMNKISEIEKAGGVVYKAKYNCTHKLADLTDLPLGTSVSVAGRVILKRCFGKLIFAQIYEIEGIKQISLSLADVGQEQFDHFRHMVDLGDFVGCTGKLYKTHVGELTVEVQNFELLSKALRGLPEKFHGLSDIEVRYRQRYLDLIANEKIRFALLTRFKALRFIRSFYEKHGFLEVETPVLQRSVGGALAKPFMTHHNALDIPMNLRISPELCLKKVLAGGFNRIFEVAKDFRNEGLSPDKLQEFTMIESYAAYWDFEDSIKFYTELFRETVNFVFGKYEFTYQGQTIKLPEKFERINYSEELSKIVGFDILKEDDPERFKKIAIEKQFLTAEELKEVKTVGGVIDLIYKRKMRPNIKGPAILWNYPNLVPLARFSDKNPKIIEMFQMVFDGKEFVKGYSELVNPIQQRKGFEDQAEAKKKGDGEAMDFDEEYLLAMEHGFPPCSGIGFGVDIFMQNILDLENIRDTIFFPIIKDVK